MSSYHAWNAWFNRTLIRPDGIAFTSTRMMNAFIGKTLTEVQTAPGGQPRSFRWNGDLWIVDQVMKEWQDFDYSPLSPKKDWRTRRHRNYFHVSTLSGRSFEMYCDRGTKLGARITWVLAKELS